MPLHSKAPPPDAAAKAEVAAQQQAQSSVEEEELRALAVCQELLAEEPKESAVKQAKALRKKAKTKQKKAQNSEEEGQDTAKEGSNQLSDLSGSHIDQGKLQHSTDLQEKDQFDSSPDALPDPLISQEDGLRDCSARHLQHSSSCRSCARQIRQHSIAGPPLLSSHPGAADFLF